MLDGPARGHWICPCLIFGTNKPLGGFHLILLPKRAASVTALPM